MQANRGTKRRCGECGANFYDLDRTPIACPKCHAAYVVAAPRLPVRNAGRPPPRAAPPVVHDEVMVADADVFAEDDVLSHDVAEDDVVRDDDVGEGGESAFRE